MLSKPQKRVVICMAALIAFVLFVVPYITVRRYKASVAQTLSQSLGREVTINDISIQTFPQPGLLMNGVVIGDDPTISAEPMLRADEVLATIRISSLWRGRLEIGTLKLKYPSLNLVRSNDGRWNLESLLERARETPAAPTSKVRPESRPRFPYIESDGGRINFKVGNEKKVFALSDADFSVWLESEDQWHMRLEARPIRTDANLSDTGTLKMEGIWRRAPQLHETPIYLRLSWDNGQLGQISHLVYGRDRGWRGAVRVATEISGKPEDLAVRFDGRVDDFRRYDILSGENVSLELHCNTEYNFTAKQIRNLACQMPAGSGVLLANGNYEFLPSPRVDLSLTAENVPMQFLALVARHAKRDLPSDMNFVGMVSAVVTVRGPVEDAVWAGDGQTSPIEIRSSVLARSFTVPPTHWSLVGPGTPAVATRQTASRRKPQVASVPLPLGRAWNLHPVSLALGDAEFASLSGWFARDDYYLDLKGDAELKRLLEIAKLAGLPAPASDVTGSAKGDIQLSGEWTGFAPATITGDAQLKNITAKFIGVASPLHISSAHFAATKNAFSITKAAGSFADVHSTLDFSGAWPQHCVAVQPLDRVNCGLQFKLNADTLNTDEINSLVNPRAQKRPWYAALIGTERIHFPEIYARGQITAGKLILKSVTASRFNSMLSVTPAGFSLSAITADLWSGKYSGELNADFTTGTPAYTSSGNLQNVTMTNATTAMKDPWATGSATLSYRGNAAGWTADELDTSASGAGSFAWTNGALPHLVLADRPLQFRSFTGKLGLSSGTVTVTEGELQAQNGIYLVSGTASLGRRLELTLARPGAPGYSISGTLEHPTVAPARPVAPQTRLARSRNR